MSREVFSATSKLEAPHLPPIHQPTTHSIYACGHLHSDGHPPQLCPSSANPTSAPVPSASSDGDVDVTKSISISISISIFCRSQAVSSSPTSTRNLKVVYSCFALQLLQLSRQHLLLHPSFTSPFLAQASTVDVTQPAIPLKLLRSLRFATSPPPFYRQLSLVAASGDSFPVNQRWLH